MEKMFLLVTVKWKKFTLVLKQATTQNQPKPAKTTQNNPQPVTIAQNQAKPAKST